MEACESNLNLAPDIVSSSDSYHRRFSGPVGEFFLTKQKSIIRKLLSNLPDTPMRILEVGGGHGQITPTLLELGHTVWIQGSSPFCKKRVEHLLEQYPDKVNFFTSPLEEVPFEDKSFDVVIAIRLFGHVDDWKKFLCELTRLASRGVIFDYPPKSSFNALYSLMFWLKFKLEDSTTRHFRIFKHREIKKELKNLGAQKFYFKNEFFLPMALHRKVKSLIFTRSLEACCAILGLTELWGSPTIVLTML